jgi:hypothetical protein
VKVWQATAEQPLIPVATAGWDRRPWEATDGTGFGKGVAVSGYYDRGTAKEFKAYMSRLADWMESNPDQVTKDRLALIYAWNEIGEGGYLVPCKDDPKGSYLKAIRDVVFK